MRTEPPPSLPSASGTMPRSHRRRRAGARAAGRQRRVPGIARGREQRVVAERAVAELGGVGLADDHRAGGAQALDDDVVLLGHVVGVEARAEGRAQPGGADQVLDRHRHAGERADRLRPRARRASMRRGLRARRRRHRACRRRAGRRRAAPMRCSAASVTAAALQRRARTASPARRGRAPAANATCRLLAVSHAPSSLSSDGSKSCATRSAVLASSALERGHVWCAAVTAPCREAGRARLRARSRCRWQVCLCGARTLGTLSALAGWRHGRPAARLNALKGNLHVAPLPAAPPRPRGAVALRHRRSALPRPPIRSPSACCCPARKTDKGWMESGYDGLMAAQKKHGDKIKVQMIENISNADMEQALTTLAQKNQLVIGVGGQTQAALMKVAKRFPKVKFSHHRRQSRREPAQRQRLRRQAGRDRLRRRRGRGDAVEERRHQLRRRHRDPADRQRRHRVQQRREVGQPEHQVSSRTTPATSTTSPSRRKRRWRRSRRAPTSTITSSTSACAAWSRRPRRRAPTSSAATPTAAAPTRSTSATASPASAT